MALLFDFYCSECDATFERLVESGVTEQLCICGNTARRIISPVRSKLEGISGDFPGAAMKWARQHERAAKISE